MMIKISRPTDLASEVTPEHLYHARRRFIKAGAALSATALLAACGLRPRDTTQSAAESSASPDILTSEQDILSYNNFYEFTTDKAAVAEVARGLHTTPWQLEVGGLVRRAGVYEVDELRREFEQEERIYRLRCVEGWSMVIPWLGFPLRKLLEIAEPLPTARYVRFEALYDPEQMPGQRRSGYPWPYVEGLRLDEALHDLTLLATGLYGKPLPAQNGAPIRLVVPWKYGFKSIKSIIKIELVAEQPVSFWMATSPREYGFYANVNPDVPHPRWAQRTERRIGEVRRRRTLLFNGYADQVAQLYEGMDLSVNF